MPAFRVSQIEDERGGVGEARHHPTREVKGSEAPLLKRASTGAPTKSAWAEEFVFWGGWWLCLVAKWMDTTF